MKKPVIFLLLMGGLLQQSLAQVKPYAVSLIPDSLKKDAYIVARVDEEFLDIRDVDNMVLTVHEVNTVLNENGRRALFFHQYSDKFTSLDDAEIKVYDADGNQTQRFKQKDMTVEAISENLVDDGKHTLFLVTAPSYPITVEFSYRIRFKGTLLIPGYVPQYSNQSAVLSSYTVKLPKDLALRYKNKNTTIQPAITEDEKTKTYTWKVTNLPAYKYEEGAREEYPQVLLATDRFEFDNIPGDLKSWKDYGVWMQKLYKGLDELPPNRVAFFQDLVKNATTDREKIALLYQYLQKNFRYVSIQLGIGGLRPFSASFTDEKKYGDCKALSNYMKAMLKAVGIVSYPAIINSGNNGLPIDPDFPQDFGDHVILCVPQPKDSIWLECTSNQTDFAVLGSFTENRNALLVTDGGGVLVPTPRSSMTENQYSSHSLIKLEEDGSGQSENEIQVTGEYKFNFMGGLLNEKSDDQKAFIVRYLEFKQPDDFLIRHSQQGPRLQVALNMSTEKIPDFMAGNKMFLAPRLYRIWSQKMPETPHRKTDFYFRFPFQQQDTTEYKLPEGFSVEALPQNKEFHCSYAGFESKYWYDEKTNTIFSTASLYLSRNHIPASAYAEVKAFFDQVLREEGQRIIARKS